VVNVTTYNYYSSGDDVLAEIHAGLATPAVLAGVVGDHGRYAWCAKELFKGRHPDWVGGSRYGGWEFNHVAAYGEWVPMPSLPPAAPYDSMHMWLWQPYCHENMDLLTDETLRIAPFFNPVTSWPGVLDTTRLYAEPNNPTGVGSQFARDHRNVLLAEMIPALSYATGSQRLEVLNIGTPNANNDMNGMKNGSSWPASRGGSTEWMHGDIWHVAYLYVYKVFDDIGQVKGAFNQ
jgi:hypothetical protein